MPSTETDLADSNRPQRGFHPRAALVALVAAHLVLAALQSLPVPQWLERQWPGQPYGIADGLGMASEGILIGQMAVLATYIALGSGRWWIRFVRGALLLLWFVLALLAGTHLFDHGRDSLGFEEFTAQYTWTVAVLGIPLGIYRLVARRSVAKTELISAQNRPHQYRLAQLLLIVTEAAVLMGIIRLVVTWNAGWIGEFLLGLCEIPQFVRYDMAILGILAAVPAVLMTLHIRRARMSLSATFLWQLPLVTGLVVFHISRPLWSRVVFAEDVTFGVCAQFWAVMLCHCLGISLVIWSSLFIIRAIGYDFLPLPRRGGSGEGGRQSSEATSAA